VESPGEGKAGIPDLWTRRFRHTYAIAALEGGMPESVLQWTGGWDQPIPETYLRTLGLKQAKELSPTSLPRADRLRRGPASMMHD